VGGRGERAECAEREGQGRVAGLDLPDPLEDRHEPGDREQRRQRQEGRAQPSVLQHHEGHRVADAGHSREN
jgi:hypothetical protein